MTDLPDDSLPGSTGEDSELRCPNCDSVVTADARQCLLCGVELFQEKDSSTGSADVSVSSEPTGELNADDAANGEAGASPDADASILNRPVESAEPIEPGRVDVLQTIGSRETHPTVEFEMRERRSTVAVWLTGAFLLFVGVLAVLVVQNPGSAALAIVPTETPIEPTVTYTPTWTPLPTESRPPTETPTITPTALPSDTPRPPRTHAVASGETLFGLGLRYGVTSDSIANLNGLPPGSGIQVSQELIIPWPTPTPPLTPVEVEIGGVTVIADPSGCETYEIKGGDTFFGIAATKRIPLPALTAVNRLTEQSILQPGDTICIPRIIRGGVLPPTPGPSPTPTATQPPRGPHLLSPIRGASIDPPEGPLVFQWVAVKDLTDSEWYMVELTDLTDVDSHPMRGFTRQTSFRAPASWRPPVEETHVLRWRVSIIQVTGQRADGTFVYTFGGGTSDDAIFNWLGAVPSPTPAPTTAVEEGS